MHRTTPPHRPPERTALRNDITPRGIVVEPRILRPNPARVKQHVPVGGHTMSRIGTGTPPTPPTRVGRPRIRRNTPKTRGMDGGLHRVAAGPTPVGTSAHIATFCSVRWCVRRKVGAGQGESVGVAGVCTLEGGQAPLPVGAGVCRECTLGKGALPGARASCPQRAEGPQLSMRASLPPHGGGGGCPHSREQPPCDSGSVHAKADRQGLGVRSS